MRIPRSNVKFTLYKQNKAFLATFHFQLISSCASMKNFIKRQAYFWVSCTIRFQIEMFILKEDIWEHNIGFFKDMISGREWTHRIAQSLLTKKRLLSIWYKLKRAAVANQGFAQYNVSFYVGKPNLGKGHYHFPTLLLLTVRFYSIVK